MITSVFFLQENWLKMKNEKDKRIYLFIFKILKTILEIWNYFWRWVRKNCFYLYFSYQDFDCFNLLAYIEVISMYKFGNIATLPSFSSFLLILRIFLLHVAKKRQPKELLCIFTSLILQDSKVKQQYIERNFCGFFRTFLGIFWMLYLPENPWIHSRLCRIPQSYLQFLLRLGLDLP